MTVRVLSPGPAEARSLVPHQCARSSSQPSCGRRETWLVASAAPNPGNRQPSPVSQASPSNREVEEPPEIITPSLPSPDVEVHRSSRHHVRRLSAQSDQSRAASNASWVLTESAVMQLPREDGGHRRRQHMLTPSLHDIHECSPSAVQKSTEGPSPAEVRLEVTILELQQELERHQELLKEKCALIETLTVENNTLRSLAGIPERESASTSSGVSLVVTATEDAPQGPSSSAGSDVSVETRLERTPATRQPNKVDSPGDRGSECVSRNRSSDKSVNSSATTASAGPTTMSARPSTTRTPTAACRSGSLRDFSNRQKKEQGLARSQSAMSVGHQSSPPARRMRSSSVGKFSGRASLELSRGTGSTESVAAQGAKIMASWSAAPAPTAREDPARGPGRVRERSYNRPWAKAGDTRFRRGF